MVDGTATLVTISGALVLLYVLIKGHIYVTKKFWMPVIEEQVEAEEADTSTTDGDDEEEARRPRRGWDEVG